MVDVYLSVEPSLFLALEEERETIRSLLHGEVSKKHQRSLGPQQAATFPRTKFLNMVLRRGLASYKSEAPGLLLMDQAVKSQLIRNLANSRPTSIRTRIAGNSRCILCRHTIRHPRSHWRKSHLLQYSQLLAVERQNLLQTEHRC